MVAESEPQPLRPAPCWPHPGAGGSMGAQPQDEASMGRGGGAGLILGLGARWGPSFQA